MKPCGMNPWPKSHTNGKPKHTPPKNPPRKPLDVVALLIAVVTVGVVYILFTVIL